MKASVTLTRHPDASVVIVCDAGYELIHDALTVVGDVLGDEQTVVVTGPVTFTSRDGVHASTWSPTALTPWQALANPLGIPPVWAMRSECQAALAATDVDIFALADMWIRALRMSSGARVAMLSEPIARFELPRATRWEQVIGSDAYEYALRRFLQRHLDTLESNLRDIVVFRELQAVRLTAVHADAVNRRDADAAEMSRLENVIAEGRVRLAELGRAHLDWGSFARTSPVARDWGNSRGGAVDRRYIRAFVAAHSSDIQGRVLEVQEDDLTKAYGGLRVRSHDVLDINASNARATVVADLRDAHSISSSSYDCIILTQTAHIIDDIAAAIRECHRMLAPGGVLLATFPALSRVCLEYGPDGDFWRLTAAGVRHLLALFEGVDVQAYGNVKTAVAFLHGLGEHELSQDDYAVHDPYNPLVVGARARKRLSSRQTSIVPRNFGAGTNGIAAVPRSTRGVILLFHRIDDAATDGFHLNVSSKVFLQYLDWLEANGSICPLESLLSLPPEELPLNPVALTFDDGYAHHLSMVAPLLAERDIPAAFFLTTAGLDVEYSFWWEALEYADGGTPERREQLTRATLPQRVAKGPSSRAPCASSRRPLKRAEIRRLAAFRGVTIGAHGVEHLFLPAQPLDVRVAEMRESKHALEETVNRDIALFSYPYGAVDDVTADIARQEFRWSLANHPAPLGVSFDAARVPRLDVKAWKLQEFAARVTALWGYGPAGDDVRLLP